MSSSDPSPSTSSTGMDSATSDDARPMAWMRSAKDIIRFAVELGASEEALLATAGIDRQALADHDAQLPLVKLYDVMEQAARATLPKAFGLRYARDFDLEVFDAVGFLMMTSETLGDALRRGFACQRLWAQGEWYSLDVDGDEVTVGYHPFGPPREAHRLFAEFAFFDMGVNAGRMCGQAMPLKRIRFRHSDVSYADVFDCEVELDASVNELVFSADALNWPLPDANAAMCAYFERQSKAQLAQVATARADSDGVLHASESKTREPLATRVSSLIAAVLPEQAPDLAILAKSLGMSGRTLQRRLKDEGQTLHGLIERTRKERALAFLDQPMALAEISYLLGYSEPSAFHRAFRRWMGTTPEAYRASKR